MDDATHTVHPITPDEDAAALVERLTAPGRERTAPGLHVVVHVTTTGSIAYGRLVAPGETGDGSQRWLQLARRGSSPGGWSEQHHPRGETHVGEWKDANAGAIDRVLIQHAKRAWTAEGEPPYVVEFEPVAFETAAAT